jgi:hypothetical protein
MPKATKKKSAFCLAHVCCDAQPGALIGDMIGCAQVIRVR